MRILKEDHDAVLCGVVSGLKDGQGAGYSGCGNVYCQRIRATQDDRKCATRQETGLMGGCLAGLATEMRTEQPLHMMPQPAYRNENLLRTPLTQSIFPPTKGVSVHNVTPIAVS